MRLSYVICSDFLDLTPFAFASKIRGTMGLRGLKVLLVPILAASVSACGLAYDASTHARASHMMRALKPGESSLEVHQNWGEPDLRQYVGREEEVWSYAIQPNSNDVPAMVLYTSVKPGDNGSFLDLKFINGRLVSWNKAERTVPAKQGAGFNLGVGPGGALSNIAHF